MWDVTVYPLLEWKKKKDKKNGKMVEERKKTEKMIREVGDLFGRSGLTVRRF